MRLGIAKPFVRGLLETVWDVAHECGNPKLGTPEDVEIAAEWPRRKPFHAGKLFEALRDGNWIEEYMPGTWRIHDYWDHAPDYVRDRKRKEDSRKNHSYTLANSAPISEARVGKKNEKIVYSNDNGLRDESPGHSGKFPSLSGTPTRAPTPTPNKEETPIPPSGAGGADSVTAVRQSEETTGFVAAVKQPKAESLPPGFLRFWAEWPSHFRKKGRSKCLRIWIARGLEEISKKVVDAVRLHKVSAEWNRNDGQYIPGPEPWLNDEAWEVPQEALFPGSKKTEGWDDITHPNYEPPPLTPEQEKDLAELAIEREEMKRTGKEWTP